MRLFAAEDDAAAWSVGDECSEPDPQDIEPEGVDNVREVSTTGTVGMIPYVAGPHNTRTVAELIAAGEVEED